MEGLTHIIYGNGKGKTTSAVGCAVRAAGCGMRVVFISMMKDGSSSENAILEGIGNIKVINCDRNYGFTFNMTEKDKADITACHGEMLRQGLEICKSGGCDMLVIDEFFCAYEYGLIDRTLAQKVVFERPCGTELVLTGHNVEQKFLDAADYVTRLENEKHPYEKGVQARKGIEY